MRLTTVAERMNIRRDSAVYRAIQRPYAANRERRGNRSFSQFAEDLIIQRLLPPGVGRYLDVGSGDPVVGSNTYLLYRSGWQGTLIDPVHVNIERARRYRPRDQAIQALCSEVAGTAEFYEYDPYQLSTTVPERVAELARMGHHPTSRYPMRTIALRELDLRVLPNEAFVLSVDVEGADLNVLKGIDWDCFRPRLVCVEEHTSPLEGVTPIGEYLRDRNYALRSYAVVTSIYEHRAARGDDR